MILFRFENYQLLKAVFPQLIKIGYAHAVNCGDALGLVPGPLETDFVEAILAIFGQLSISVLHSFKINGGCQRRG